MVRVRKMQITTQSKTAYERKNISCDNISPLKLITYDILRIFAGLIPYLLAIAFGLSFRTILMAVKGYDYSINGMDLLNVGCCVLMVICIKYIHKAVK